MLRSFKILFIFFYSLVFINAGYPANLGIGVGGIKVNKEVKSLKDIRTQDVILQSLDYSCGPAALATLLNYYFEDKVSEKEIIAFLLLTGNLEKIKARKGFSLLDLKNFAKYKGYEVVGYKMDLEFLLKLNKPVLIPVNIKEYAHFVIFRGLKGKRVFLADPAMGKITISLDKFLKMWQGGIGLVLSKKGEENLSSALKLSSEEEAVFSDSQVIKNVLGINSLGRIYQPDEF